MDRKVNDMNSKKIFQCEVCNIRIEDWVTVELDPDDVHQIDMQFSYCPKCGTPLGKELYLNHREQALNSVHAVAGTDTCDSIRVVTDFGIIALRVNEPFYLQKNRYRVSIIISKVSNKFFYNVEICQNNMWQSTVISKSTMTECLLTLAKKLQNGEEIVK